jgi:hypothetical protein
MPGDVDEPLQPTWNQGHSRHSCTDAAVSAVLPASSAVSECRRYVLVCTPQIGDAGAAALPEALKSNATLKELQ